MVIVLGLVLLFGVGQFFAFSNLNTANQGQNNGANGNANTPPTQVITYHPAAPLGAKTVSGSCWTNSIAAPYRADAWRCMVGNSISDPCFALSNSSSGPQQVVCDVDPLGITASSTFVITVTKPLPPPTVPTSTHGAWGWFVALEDGTLCAPFTGTRPFAKTGEVATFACEGPKPEESLLFGDFNAAGPTWTAEVGSLSAATGTGAFPPAIVSSATVPVAAVWQ